MFLRTCPTAVVHPILTNSSAKIAPCVVSKCHYHRAQLPKCPLTRIHVALGNADGNCGRAEQRNVLNDRHPPVTFLLVFVCLFGVSSILVLSLRARAKHKNRHLPTLSASLPPVSDRDAKYALNMIGHHSVY